MNLQAVGCRGRSPIATRRESLGVIRQDAVRRGGGSISNFHSRLQHCTPAALHCSKRGHVCVAVSQSSRREPGRDEKFQAEEPHQTLAGYQSRLIYFRRVLPRTRVRATERSPVA